MTCFLVTPYYSDSQCRVDNISRLQLESLYIVCVHLGCQSRCLKANLGNWLSRLFVGLALLCVMATCLAAHSHSAADAELPADAELKILVFWPTGNVVSVTVCKEGTTLD